LGYRSEGSGLRIGIQHTLNAQWRLGASAGASQNRLTANGFSSRGKTYDASVSVTHQRGPLEITGALAVARGNYRNERTPQLGVAGRILNLEQTYNSASDTTLLGARLRTAYTVQRDGYFVKPYLDLDLIHTRSPGFTESGRGPLALEVGGVNKTQVVISPMVQVGTQRELDSGAVVRGYVSAGASILPNNQRTSQNRLAGSNARIGSFNLTSEGPKAVGRLNLGLEVKAPKQQNVTFRAEYSAQAGGNYRSQNISAQLNIRF
jgi:outer membrane autotransporter protein